MKPRFCDVPRPNKLAAIPLLIGLLLVAVLAIFLAGVLGSGIAVSSAYAASPVSVLDPQTELSSSNAAAYDWFGSAVATSGDTALVGDPIKTVKGHIGAGVVYVFTRSGGAWIQRAELTAPKPVAGGHFGQSLAICGTTALVGQTSGVGSAYVFTGSGSSWTRQAELVASVGTANDWFGYSVALSGDTALVGAPNADVAYVFARSGAAWSQQAKLAGADATTNDSFGWSVALEGDTALIGAPHDTWGHEVAPHTSSSGAVGPGISSRCSSRPSPIRLSMRTSSAARRWHFRQTAAPPCSAPLEASVAGQTETGMAVHLHKPGSSLRETGRSRLSSPTLMRPEPACSGDRLRFKATLPWSATSRVNASVFDGAGSSWTQQAELTDNATVYTFGASVALDGGTALVGDPEQTAGSQKQDGAAYVYGLDSTASPVESATPVVAGTPAVGHTLSCSSGTWTGTPTPTFAYQWLRNGQPIGGATTATYLVHPADLGHQLACQVMAANSEGQAWANSNALSVLAPALSLKTSSRAVAVGRTVTVSGSVKHSLAAGKTVDIYRKVSSKLILLKKATLSSSGTFKAAIRLKKTGSWVVLACYKVYGVTFKSKTVTVTVRS